ncbi:MAG: hypothetical protein AAB608_02905 [Patescibacteria group bacterium]
MKLAFIKKIALLGTLVFVGTLLWAPSPAAAGLLDIGEITFNAVEKTILYLLVTLRQLVGATTALLAGFLEWSIILSTKAHEYTFVRDIWVLARNFVNMLFILAMVTMAYATILKIWPNYTIQKMLPQVLAVAILMNFSFAITITGVEIFDSISTTILASTQDAMKRVGSSLNIEEHFKISNQNLYENTAEIPQAFFSIFLLSFVAISFLIAVIFSLIRVPILWILLIASPVALFAYLIPSLKKKIWDRWVSEFIKWNTFLPIFLLALYVGLYTLAQQKEIIAVTETYSGSNGIFGFAFGVIFFYLLVGFIFLGGTAAAISGGVVAGSGAVWGATKAKQMTYDALGITGAQRAWQAKVKEIEKGGLKGQIPGGIGKTFDKLYDTPGIRKIMPKGEKGVEDSTKTWARRFGLSESQFAKNIGEEKKSLQDKDVSIEALRDTLRKKNYEDPETFAAAQILLDKGKLSLDGMREVYQKYAEISPRAAKAFGDRIAEKVNKQVEDGEIAGAPNLNKALELMAQISGGDEKLLKVRDGEAPQQREVRIIEFEQKTEIARDRVKDLLKKAKKKDPNWTTERQILRQTYEEKDEKGIAQTKDYITLKNVEGVKLREVSNEPEDFIGPRQPLPIQTQLEQGLEAALSGLDSKALRELPRDLFEPKAENKTFITQLLKVLESDRGRIGGIIKRATPEQRRKIEFWADVAEYRALANELGPVSAPLPSASVKLKGKALVQAKERQQEIHQKFTAPDSNIAPKLFAIGIPIRL